MCSHNSLFPCCAMEMVPWNICHSYSTSSVNRRMTWPANCHCAALNKAHRRKSCPSQNDRLFCSARSTTNKTSIPCHCLAGGSGNVPSPWDCHAPGRECMNVGASTSSTEPFPTLPAPKRGASSRRPFQWRTPRRNCFQTTDTACNSLPDSLRRLRSFFSLEPRGIFELGACDLYSHSSCLFCYTVQIYQLECTPSIVRQTPPVLIRCHNAIPPMQFHSFALPIWETFRVLMEG